MSDVVYRYVAERNPDRLTIPGVPLRDLTHEDLARLPMHLRAAVPLYDFYDAVAVTAQRAVDDAVHVPAAVERASRRERAARPSETKATEPERSAAADE